MLLRSLLLASIGLVALQTSAPAWGDSILYYNLQSPPQGQTTTVAGDGPLGQSFNSPNGSSFFTLTDIKLMLSAGNDSGSINVSVYSDIGSPGSPSPDDPLLSVTNLSDSYIYGQGGQILYNTAGNPASGIVSESFVTLDIPLSVDMQPLAASDPDPSADSATTGRFWVVLSDNCQSNDCTTTSVDWATNGDGSGSGWQNEWLFFDGASGDNADNFAYLMSVNGVPEPATLFVLGFSLLGLGVARRRKVNLSA